jgi:sialate O-acetylesterase
MVVTTDLSDPNTIHPTKKLEVGRRLANLALNRAYEKSTNSFFPLASSFKVIGSTVRVIFQNTYGDLLLEPTQNQAGFELLDSAGKWQPAQAMVEGRGISVNSKLVDSPKGVRYNYSDNPIGKLRGGTGLPAAPFIWVAK